MALTKAQKQDQIALLTEKLKDCESVIFAHYRGLSVSDISDLRSKLRESDAEMKVCKKTLMKLALKEAGLPEVTDDLIEGPIGCIFSFADPLSGAQVSFKFGKDHDQVELIGGIFDGKVLTKEEATALAKMPSREQLLATFVGMVRSPLTSFAGMCNSPLAGFARALDQIAEKGGLSGAAPEAAEETPAQEAPAAEEAAATEEAPAEESNDSKESNDSNDGVPAETAEADAAPEAAEEAAEDSEKSES